MTENEVKSKLDSLHYKIIHTSFCNKVYVSEIEALCLAKDVLQEIQQYRAIGTIGEFKALKEKNEKQLEAIKLLTIAAICYEKNLDIIRKEMKENKELVTLYCKLPTVQYIKNTIALSKLANSDIDVNNIESIDEIIRIFDWQ